MPSLGSMSHSSPLLGPSIPDLQMFSLSAEAICHPGQRVDKCGQEWTRAELLLTGCR